MNWADYFYYDESSPSCLRWAVKKGGKTADSVAGTRSVIGYYALCVTHEDRRRMAKVHRVIWELVRGPIPEGMEIDHINGDCSDNHIHNLRLTSRSENQRNTRRQARREEWQSTGVHWITCKGKLTARAMWSELSGTKKCVSFSVSAYGLLPAYSKAVEARRDAIRRMNVAGANYTERHGK